jgi:hypothetical protein
MSMAKSLDWSKIKDSFTGFENLAYKFVTDKYPHPSWTKTSQTRDGNRDAYASSDGSYTIVFGFQPYLARSEEWWMEAKYSTKRETTDRYRLDATIVSAIISGNVSKVIFVTNTIVSAKTISDIRNALKNSIGCNDVNFCTKYTLEQWLVHNPSIFSEYFPDSDILDISFPEIFITEHLEFYSDAYNRLAFREPLQALEKGSRYYGYCSVFCNQETKLRLNPARNLCGITIQGNRVVTLSAGENNIKIIFDLDMNFGKKKHGTFSSKSVPEPSFLLGNAELMPKKSVSVMDRAFPLYKIKSQQEIIENIKNDISVFNKRNGSAVSFLLGHSGVGKSFIIRNVINSKMIENKNVFLVNASHSELENEESLLRLVLFILFPYIDAAVVNSEYIATIGGSNYIGDFLREAILHRSDPDELHRLISEHSRERTFLAGDIQIGCRIIIIDDYHKMGIASNEALMRIIEEIYIRRLPVFILVGSQPQFERQYYNKALETVPIEEYSLAITQDDLTECVETKLGNRISVGILSAPFKSALEIFLFIRFLDDAGLEIVTIDDLKKACATFYESRLAREFILKYFKDAFLHNPLTRPLCENIYWASGGISLSMSRELELLYSHNLVRQGIDGEVVPYHDIYAHYFKQHYKRPTDLNNNCDQKPLERLQCVISNCIVQNSEFLHSVETVVEFVKNRKFYSAYYVLVDTFSNRDHQTLKNMFGTHIYYKLYMAYALASTNLSMRVSGRSLFSRIYSETRHIPNVEIRKICNDALWELTNSCYEWLEFTVASQYADELITRIGLSCEYNITKPNIQSDINYHNAQVIKTLIASDMNFPTVSTDFEDCCREIKVAGFTHRYHAFRLRYALTLLARNGEYACSVIEDCRDAFGEMWGEEGKQEKFYLWSGMDAAYMRMILDNNPAHLQSMTEFQDKLKKNYYNDYRKSLLAVASYFYGKGDIQGGNYYFFQDSYVSRELRPRQQGFYHETLALHDVVQGDVEGALKNLHLAHEIFKNIPSYADIIAHNIKLLRDGFGGNIGYHVNDDMQPNIFYIDPRCIW